MKLKKLWLIYTLFALTVCGAACQNGGDNAIESSESPSADVSYEQTDSEASSDTSSEEIKTAAVQALENAIAALPSVSNLTLADKGEVDEAECAFAALTEEEKATVENYDVLFSAIERIVFLNNVWAADAVIETLPDAQSVTLEDASKIEQVYHLIGALGEDECLALADYDKLIACHARLISLRKIAHVNELIAYLPAIDVVDESYLAQIDEAAAALTNLTKSEQAEVQNAGAIEEVRAAVTVSYWKDAKLRKHYVAGQNVTFKINLKQNAVATLTVDGTTLSSAQYAYANGILTIYEEALQALTVGMHVFELTDSRDKSFPFLVGVGYEEKSTAYFDFDVIGYTSPADLGVPCQTIENGIDGYSGRFTKPTALANIFGFFKGGEFGFVDYTFKTGEVYLLEFDVRILDGTDDAWWMPIFFGGKGDVAYLYKDYTLVFPQMNTLYSEGGIEMRDGYAHVKAIFRATNETANLEFANWGGGVDILLDNILLTALPDTAVVQVQTQIANLPNQISASDKALVESVKAAYEKLSLAEQQTVENASKLEDLMVQLSLIENAASVVDMIEKLPDADASTAADYPAILAVKEAYDALGETAQAYVTNSEKLFELLLAMGESYWNESGVEFYLTAGASFSVKVELLNNGIHSVTLNGNALEESQYTYLDGVLDFGALFVGKTRDVYTLTLTDGVGKQFTFFVFLDIEKGSATYYDFDYYTYSNTNGAAISSTQYADGIQGSSQRFVKDSAAGTVFGFFRDGNFGFVPYAFESGATYTLSFDIKVLDGTADNWWMPIFFSGGKGDVVYVKQTNGEVYLQTYSLDSLNAKNRQTVVDNGDGSYRITVTFTLREDVSYDNLEFSNFDGAVDILLDNVLLIQE